MDRFLIDEDMPRSIADLLKSAGFECFDVRDIGLKGSKDELIFRWAQENKCTIRNRQGGRMRISSRINSEKGACPCFNSRREFLRIRCRSEAGRMLPSRHSGP
jgi:hypothetical protein